MQVVKNGEKIGTVKFIGISNVVIDVNINRVTTQEMLHLVELSRQLAAEKKNIEGLVVKLTGIYPTEAEQTGIRPFL